MPTSTPEIGYQDIFKSSPAAILIIDIDAPHYTILDANDAYCHATNTQRCDMIGTSVFGSFPANPTDEVSRNIEMTHYSFQQAIQTKQSHTMANYRYDIPIRGTGEFEERYWTTTNTPILDASGEVRYFIHSPANVTELYKLNQKEQAGIDALKNQRQQLYSSFMQAPLGICIISSGDLVVQMVNDSYLELVGKDRSELEHKGIWEAVPEAADAYAPILNQVINTGEPFFAKEHEVVFIRNGTPESLFLDFVYEPISHVAGENNAVMVIVIDVTDKVLARRRIEEAEERARLAIEAAEIGTFDFDPANDTVVTSERFNAIFGFDGTRTREEFRQRIHKEDLAARQAAHERAAETGKLFYEARLIWPDGSLHWIRIQADVYYNGGDKPYRMLGTVLDITEFKRLQQQKDDFISVASHELKTPMTSVKASMQLLERLIKTQPSSDKIPAFLEKANTSLTKMQHLVDALLNVSKIAAGQLALHKSDFVAADMANECCDHVRLMGTHELILTGDTRLQVYADKERIDQVVVNLVNNAVKYAPDSNKIFLHIAQTGKMAKISVQDFGRGIPPEKLPHLFERYYRVDASGVQFSGLGLGLYISAEIIERHGGQIGVNSVVGEGSTFWFTLPLSSS
ncbi:PAS domain S-box protein [Mucilaginibacter sp. ZT4R22]|uniref:histidine kinase n=1 Tax=Mucilaginibacter pankratovii TaxID=2772110 RepID=A0ABR7WKL7_9SPHI|nr:ATP-binding protein [Mucilaginibacter pankratovii]MBD1362859.1 PAS domain S-box protein [Mucilaginibacter pankratovii]